MAKSDRKSASPKGGAARAKPAKSPAKPRKSGPKRKVDWEINDQLIKESFYELLRLRKRAPKISEISERTGLSYSTVQRHIEQMDLDEIRTTSPARLMRDEVLIGLAKSAIGGNPRSAELYMELMHGYSKPTRVEHTGKDGGPIEIDDGISDDRRAAAIIAILERRRAQADRSGSESADDMDPE